MGWDKPNFLTLLLMVTLGFSRTGKLYSEHNAPSMWILDPCLHRPPKRNKNILCIFEKKKNFGIKIFIYMDYNEKCTFQ